MERQRPRPNKNLRRQLPKRLFAESERRVLRSEINSDRCRAAGTQVYPESVGMGVGFSVMVGANFEQTKKRLEQKIGKPLNKCEPPSDNMRTCELTIGPKKTLLLVAEDPPKTTTTLFGCYYFYAK
jgi:hypothetical protein